MGSLILDTNILVSAIYPARVVESVLYGEVSIYFNHDIYEEYKEVLNRPKFSFKQEFIQDILSGLFECGNMVNVEPSKIALPDESDRKFYDVAKATNSLLITGNRKHFPSESFIISPAEFLK